MLIAKHDKVLCCLVTALTTFTVMIGCGSGDDPGPLPEQISIPTQGKLTVDGKSFGPALLSFVNITNGEAAGLEAKVSQDGTFDTLTYSSDTAPQGSYRALLSMDPAEMTMTEVPAVKPVTVDVSVPADGQPLTLEVNMTSTGEAMSGGSPNPDAATTQ